MRLGKYETMTDKLSGEYKIAFDYVEAYSKDITRGGSYKNEKMMDLLDILLTAQEEGQEVEKILGPDLDKFSKNFFSDATFIDLIVPLVSKIKILAWILLILEADELFSLRNEPEFNFLVAKTSVSTFSIIFLVICMAAFLMDLISIVLVKLNCFSRKNYNAMEIVAISVALVIVAYVLFSDMEIVVTPFPIVVAATIYLAVFYGLKLLSRYKKIGIFSSFSNEYDMGFLDLIEDEVQKNDYSKDIRTLKAYSKRYSTMNKKRISKGLNTLSTEEFFHKVETEDKYAIPAGFLLAYIVILLLGGFEDIYDSIEYLVLMIALYLLFFARFLKMNNRSILKRCKEEGIEIDQLYEKHKSLQSNMKE